MEPGEEILVLGDACGLLGENNQAWWEGAEGRFRVPELPWYLTLRFIPGQLYVIADQHAPLGVFEGEYEYDTSYSSIAMSNRNAFRITVEEDPFEPVASVAFAVQGEGSVHNDYVACGEGQDRCAVSYAMTDQIELSVAPQTGWDFARVEGCTLQATTMNGTIVLAGATDHDMSCVVVFEPAEGNVSLGVAINGGGGNVMVQYDGTNEVLTAGRALSIPAGTAVTLTAQSTGSHQFSRWSGDCSGSNPEFVMTVNANASCSAEFVPVTVEGFALNVTVEGQGSVTIGNQAPCNSEDGCATYQASPGEVVELTAVPYNSFSFAGWSGDCTGMNPSLSVTVNSNLNCTATFTAVDCNGAAPPTLGRIVLEDVNGNEIGSNLDTLCSLPVTQNQPFVLRADGFVSNVGAPLLYYSWDTTYQAQPDELIEFDHYFDTITITKQNTGCQGIYLQVMDECGMTVDTYIGVDVN
jgi:hypothetical protein